MKRIVVALFCLYSFGSFAQPIAITSVTHITDTSVGQYKKFEIGVVVNQLSPGMYIYVLKDGAGTVK